MKFIKSILALVLAAAVVLATPSWASSRSPYSHSEMRALKRAAAKGDTEAMVTVGEAYLYGFAPGHKTDQKQALKWFLKAADAGNAKAMRNLGDVYSHGDDSLRDEALGFRWLENGAILGDVFAQGLLARIFESPTKQQNYASAYEWTLKAALQGDDYAVQRLQTLYFYENDVASFDEAVQSLSDAADSGDMDAKWRLAYIFMNSDYGREDDARADSLLEAAFAKGSPQAMYVLGILQLGQTDANGESHRRGADLLRMAADAGYIPARLQWAHYQGDRYSEITEDDPNARLVFHWYLDAAERGYPDAQIALANYYSKGLFVEKDEHEARKWAILSVRLPYRKDMPIFLSPEVLRDSESQRRADAWIAAHPEPYWPRDDFSR